jgi:hypothetical protein
MRVVETRGCQPSSKVHNLGRWTNERLDVGLVPDSEDPVLPDR